MGKNRSSNGINKEGYDYEEISDELDKVTEGLENYTNYEDLSFMDDDEITDYIDSQMDISTHQFTRVDKLEHFPDISEGDEIEFNSYYVSFSESMDASIEYLNKMNNTSEHIIFRTNGEVKNFDMYEYTPSEYDWQEEHLLYGYPNGEGWIVDNVRDVSDDPTYANGEKILLVDIHQK